MANPFKDIMKIKRDEFPLAILMFGYFFLVITSFWILKPLKKSLFLTFYDKIGFDFYQWHMTASQAELLAKVLNMFVAFIAVVVFTVLVKKFKRQQLTLIFSSFFMVCYVVFSLSINNPGALTVWSFYLFGDLFSTLMVATFFAFLNDSVSPDSAKRLYGLIGLGGVTGGVFGTMVLRTMIERLSTSSWLWVCFAVAVLIIFLALKAGKIVSKNPPGIESKKVETQEPKSSENPAFEGAKLVFKSPYLLSIVGIVGLYEIVSTIVDFQFSSTILHYLDGSAIGTQFATAFMIMNIVSLFVQLFLTSFIMTRFGLTVALLFLPIAITLGSTMFMAIPILWIGSLLVTADNGFAYSINQSSKETLYVPTRRDEKYKAKAFIDMFVQRFAKAIAVGVSLVITMNFTDFSSIRWLSLVSIVITVIWIIAVRYAGKKFQQMTSNHSL